LHCITRDGDGDGGAGGGGSGGDGGGVEGALTPQPIRLVNT